MNHGADRVMIPWLLVALLLGGSASTAVAIDRVRLLAGGSETGDVTRMTKSSVTLEQAAGRKEISSIDIDSILFEEEPSQLTQARINIANGGYATALEKLGEVRLGRNERELLKQEVAFYTAYAKAKIALAGGGEVGKAYQELKAFAGSASESVHYYPAVETLGDLLVAAKRYEQANKMYAVLAKAPFDSLKVRALVRSGDALKASGKPAEALRRYDAAIARGTKAEAAKDEVTKALLGKAECLAASEQLDAAIVLLAQVTSGLEEDDPTNAAVYNALGRCHEAAGQPKDALLAYLHTDLLFDRDVESHAEALSRLAILWRTAGKPEAAKEARSRLRRNYAETRWARDAG